MQHLESFLLGAAKYAPLAVTSSALGAGQPPAATWAHPGTSTRAVRSPPTHPPEDLHDHDHS